MEVSSPGAVRRPLLAASDLLLLFIIVLAWVRWGVVPTASFLRRQVFDDDFFEHAPVRHFELIAGAFLRPLVAAEADECGLVHLPAVCDRAGPVEVADGGDPHLAAPFGFGQIVVERLGDARRAEADGGEPAPVVDEALE